MKKFFRMAVVVLVFALYITPAFAINQNIIEETFIMMTEAIS